MTDEVPDLSQEADTSLAALAGGGGNDLISARQDSSNTLVSTGPDVLWTPRGGGKVPVAYSVVAHMDTSIRLSNSVRNNGEYDFQLNSRTTDIIGHEPGTLKGIVVPGYKTYSHAPVGADYLFSEGFANVSHRDPAWINHPDPGPTEPRREMAQAFVADVPTSSSGGSQSPYGALPNFAPSTGVGDPGLLTNPNPTGPSQGFSPTAPGAPLYSPNTFSPQTPGQQQQSTTDLLNSVQRFLQSRRGGSPNRSPHRSNAQGATNVASTSAPGDSFGMKLMKDLMKNQQFTPDQAAGFVGNAGGESGNFTQFHETIGATYQKDEDGNFLRDENGKKIVDTPQHLAYPNEGGRGVIQWTASRRNEFKDLIGQRNNIPVSQNQDLPEAQYSDYGNNEAMIEQDLNGSHSGAADSIRGGSTAGVPDWAQGSDVAVSTWKDFSQYEKPGVYGAWARNPTDANTRAVKLEYNRRLSIAKQYLNKYRKELSKTGGG